MARPALTVTPAALRGAFFSLFNMILGLAFYLWGARIGALASRSEILSSLWVPGGRLCFRRPGESGASSGASGSFATPWQAVGSRRAIFRGVAEGAT